MRAGFDKNTREAKVLENKDCPMFRVTKSEKRRRKRKRIWDIDNESLIQIEKEKLEVEEQRFQLSPTKMRKKKQCGEPLYDEFSCLFLRKHLEKTILHNYRLQKILHGFILHKERTGFGFIQLMLTSYQGRIQNWALGDEDGG